MHIDNLASRSFTIQSERLILKSFRSALLVLSIIAGLGTRQAYLAFEAYFELTPQEMGVRDNLLWFCLGPISLFLASFLGLIFATIAATAKHSWTKRFWFVVLWMPLLWLAIGCVAFTWLDYLGRGFTFAFSEHLWHSLLVALPMATGAACLFNVAMLVQHRPALPIATPSDQWQDIGAAIVRITVWIRAGADRDDHSVLLERMPLCCAR